MKQIFISTLVGLSFTVGVQAQDLPKPSPSASVMQRIGFTDVTIEYSRPGVNDRTIWGDLVPYNEIWRAGANKATQVITSADIKIENESLPKGNYSLFIIPISEKEWTLIFNKETELWGAGDYKKEMDQLRVSVTPIKASTPAERLEYHFTDVSMNSAVLSMNWSDLQVNLNIQADPTSQVKVNIENALADSKEEDKWKVYRSAASYARDVEMTTEGLEWIKKSVELNSTNWYSYWVYSSLLAQNKDSKQAIAMAEKSIAIGKEDAKKNDSEFSYEERIQSDIDGWKNN